jgi:peptidoglycan biosynthesis protein MviN/MurJ (putative lipid II flippase)
MVPAARDPVLRALGGLATGAAAGAAIVTGGLLALRTAQRGGTTESQDAGFFILSAAVLLGMVVAAATGWLLSRGIDEFWRRGVTATLAVFGSLMLSLVAMPADWMGGRVGLAVYLAALLAGALYAGAHARRAA